MHLVTGATGNIGSAVLAALRDAGQPVRALFRSDPGPVPHGVVAVTGDLDQPETLAPAFDGVRGVFLLPGYADMPGLVRLAERAGAHVVLLSGPSAGSGDRANAVTEYMLRSEDAVRDGDVPWTILRPNGFMSNVFRWTPQLAGGDVVRLPFPDVPVACIDPADIAAVAAAALTGEGHDAATYRLSGPEALRPADQVAVVGEVLGRALRFEPEPDDVARARMLGEMPARYVAALFEFYADGHLDESTVLPTVRQVTGREPLSFRDWARRHSADLRASADR
jgi:uncharacterized protein YbjT (DUF2867 family)